MMKKLLEVVGAVFLAFVDGKKVAMELNETPEQPLPKKKRIIKTSTTFTSCSTHVKNPSLVFSNEGFLFYSVILSPASNTFPVQFCSFSTN
ncbi:hypothetical protein ACT7DO_13145 [Bacillus pacificus]